MIRLSALLPSLLLAVGCSAARLPDMPTVAHVDLPRFMGPWYVIANIPTFIERDAHNAIERYDLNPDGTRELMYLDQDRGYVTLEPVMLTMVREAIPRPWPTRGP